MVASMTQIIALAAAPLRVDHIELLRTAIVCGCAMALLMAGHFAPL
jgi:hypothetical protein